MPNLEDSGWLADTNPTRAVDPDPPVRPIERDPAVRSALEALGTELDDAASRDPAGFFRNLRSDAWRLALHDLLTSMGRARVIVLLDWISNAAGPPSNSPLMGVIEPNEPVFLRLMRQDRRDLFDRLLSPARLTALLSACMPEQHQEGT